MKFPHVHLILLFIVILPAAVFVAGKTSSKNAVIDDIVDIKDFKKLLRTRTNVLVLFVADKREAAASIKTFQDASALVRGHGTMVLVDCSSSDGKKLCKKLKVSPSQEVLKHYKDGEFHKDYDRRLVVASMVTFMKDPTGDLPWDEDPAGAEVLHIPDAVQLEKYLRKETKPTLVMFYAPWCGYCKQMKPDYSSAAAELKPNHILAAIDVNKPENAIVRRSYNISGFPTLLYFDKGHFKFPYEGDKKKQSLIDFMKNPKEGAQGGGDADKEEEPDWAESASDIVHLTATSFDAVLKDERSALVMFYAPWCGHCKKMKPVYEKAAEILKSQGISGMLAAIDATKESAIGAKYGVKGYPSFKFFENGEFKFDVNNRDQDAIVKFMKDPSEPPPPPPPEKEWSDVASEVHHLDVETFKPFLKKKKNVLVMFYAPWCGHCKKAKPEFESAAETFKDDPKVELAAVDCTKHREVCSAYEVQGYPTIKYFSYLKVSKEYEGGRMAADFVRYLKKRASGDDSADDNEDAGSAAEPEDAFEGVKGAEYVVQLTDKTFHREMAGIKKALVFFYASWCGHCKVVKPVLGELAMQLHEEKSAAKVVAIDASANGKIGNEFNIKGFPTIRLFLDGKITAVEYNQARTKDAFYKFLQANGPKDEL